MTTSGSSFCVHLAIAALALICSGCASVSGILPPQESVPATNAFRAGAAKADITPPPGYPMGGHAIAAHTSRGHWLRLHVRSIYLESPSGERVALASADLWSMPAGLGDRVVELLGTNAQLGCRLGRSQLLLAATHTHQSPGNFSTSPLYNAFGSNEPGFDPYLFDFLAARIASAVAASCEGAVPARLAFASARVGGVARNRSMEAFRANREAEAIIEANRDLPLGEPNPLYPDELAFRAILPSLDTFWIREARAPGYLIAVAAFFPIHPTALSHEATFYSSDLTGWAAIATEQRLAQSETGSRPVVAMFNGAEGDVSPVWQKQNREDVERVGEALVGAIVEQRGNTREIATEISVRYAVYPFAGVCLASDPSRQQCLSNIPMPGPAMLGGAEDGRTWLYEKGCREGTSFDDVPGAQRPGAICGLIHFFQPLIVTLFPGPRVVPIGVYRIGPTVLVALPGEFTTTMGMRIRHGLRKALQGTAAPEQIVVIGLANEYVSYVTTPEEFHKYSYESGSTIYGPLSGPLVAELVTELATSSPAAPTPRSYAYDTGIVRSFSPSEIMRIDQRSADHQLRDIMLGDKHASTVWRQHCFDAPAPSLHDAGLGSASMPSVHVELLAAGTWRPAIVDGSVEDDRGLHFVTLLADWYGASSTWCATWVARRDRLHGLRDDDTLRLCADGSKENSCSAPFTLMSAVIPASP